MKINSRTNETTRQYLTEWLKREEASLKQFYDLVQHWQPPRMRRNVERKHFKRIQALKIIIYMLTPDYERTVEPTTFRRKAFNEKKVKTPKKKASVETPAGTQTKPTA